MAPNEREFSVIIPKKDNEGHDIDVDAISSIAKEMSSHFGGVTVNASVLGCYINKKKNLQCEENTKLSSSRDLKKGDNPERKFANDRRFMNKIGKTAGKKFGQETIFLQENIVQDNIFIPGKEKKEIPSKLREKDIFRRKL